jgi:hypothetical protein
VGDDYTPAAHPRRARFVAIQWISGPLFMIGLLGLLRRQFDDFFSAPGVSIVGLRSTPFGYLVLFILGGVGIAALRSERLGARYLPMIAAVLAALAVIGRLAGGMDADGLAFNDRMMTVLIVLAAAAAVVAQLERRARSALS